MNKPIILVGFMGSGKSTVARKLSFMKKMPLIDTDDYLESKEEKSISDMFVLFGETHFRELETRYLKEILDKTEDHIISTGGGIVISPANRETIKEKKNGGKVIYFKARPETIYKRVRDSDDRPLLKCDDPLLKIYTLLNEREELYEEVADIVIDTDDKDTTQIAEEIIGKI